MKHLVNSIHGSPDRFLSYTNPVIAMRKSGTISFQFHRRGFLVRPDTNIQSRLNSGYKYSTRQVGNKVVLDKKNKTTTPFNGERRGHRTKLKEVQTFPFKVVFNLTNSVFIFSGNFEMIFRRSYGMKEK